MNLVGRQDQHLPSLLTLKDPGQGRRRVLHVLAQPVPQAEVDPIGPMLAQMEGQRLGPMAKCHEKTSDPGLHGARDRKVHEATPCDRQGGLGFQRTDLMEARPLAASEEDGHRRRPVEHVG
jgi:hypothetical protein